MEVIEFVRPESNRRNLFVSIPTFRPEISLDLELIWEQLHKEFSKFGLIYEVQVFPSIAGASSAVGRANHMQVTLTSVPLTDSGTRGGRRVCPGHFAFIKFYSYTAAKQAKATLNSRLQVGGQPCKVSFAQRTKGDNSTHPLPYCKCVELANFYLGFNGWSSSIRQLSQDGETGSGGVEGRSSLRFYCHLDISITGLPLRAEGFGAWEDSFITSVATSRAQACVKSRKLSFQRAVEDAFSQVLLVVLPDGRVFPEVNTLKPQSLQHSTILQHQVLPVNELDEMPEREEEPEILDNDDDFNLHLLQELEDV